MGRQWGAADPPSVTETSRDSGARPNPELSGPGPLGLAALLRWQSRRAPGPGPPAGGRGGIRPQGMWDL